MVEPEGTGGPLMSSVLELVLHLYMAWSVVVGLGLVLIWFKTRRPTA